jgi:hypothetical protein
VIVGIALDGLGEELDGFFVTLGLEGLVSFVLVFGRLLTHKKIYFQNTL